MTIATKEKKNMIIYWLKQIKFTTAKEERGRKKVKKLWIS